MILVNNTATNPCLLPFTEPWTSQRRRAKNNFVLKQVIPKTLTIHVKVLRTDLFQNGKVQWTCKFWWSVYRYIIISATISIWTAWKILIIARKSNLFLQLRFCSFRDNKIGMYNIIYHACSPALRPLTFISRVELV